MKTELGVRLKIVVTNLETGEEVRIDECVGSAMFEIAESKQPFLGSAYPLPPPLSYIEIKAKIDGPIWRSIENDPLRN